MPMISTSASFNNRQRQSIQENFGIQLPLIETNRSRVVYLYFSMWYYFVDLIQPISGNSISRKTAEPLDVLPLKRRRNPLVKKFPYNSLMIHLLIIFQSHPILLTSEDDKRGLVPLVERTPIPQIAPISIEPLPKTNDPPLRLRSLSRGKTIPFFRHLQHQK